MNRSRKERYVLPNRLHGLILDWRSGLNYRADHEVEVYLAPDRRSFEMPHRLKYAVGIYDGKIRLLADHHDKEVLKKIAAHEYTHHVLHGLTNRNIPFWCNEGLAPVCIW